MTSKIPKIIPIFNRPNGAGFKHTVAFSTEKFKTFSSKEFKKKKFDNEHSYINGSNGISTMKWNYNSSLCYVDGFPSKINSFSKNSGLGVILNGL